MPSSATASRTTFSWRADTTKAPTAPESLRIHATCAGEEVS